MNWRMLCGAAYCLALVCVGACNNKRPFKFVDGTYAMRMTGEVCDDGQTPKKVTDTDIFNIARNGEEVVLALKVSEAFKMLPPQKQAQVKPMLTVKGKMTGGRFTCSQDNGGVVNEFVGRLVADNRIEGTWTCRLPDGTLRAEGAWIMEPTRLGD